MLQHRGLENTKSEYVTAILACARSGDTGRALFLLRNAAKRGVPLLSVDVASAMRVVCKQGTGWRQALALYEGFLELALGQAQATISPLDETQPGHADAQVPVPLLGHRQQLHLLKEVAPGWEDVCQAALEACNSGGQWEAALKVLSVLRAGGGGAELSEAAYTEAIEVCGNGKAWDMVLLLVAEMSSDEIPMTAVTCDTALKASGDPCSVRTPPFELLPDMHTVGSHLGYCVARLAEKRRHPFDSCIHAPISVFPHGTGRCRYTGRQ